MHAKFLSKDPLSPPQILKNTIPYVKMNNTARTGTPYSNIQKTDRKTVDCDKKELRWSHLLHGNLCYQTIECASWRGAS